jgi:hypothetical protein
MTTVLAPRPDPTAAEAYPVAAGYPRVRQPRIVRCGAIRGLAIDGREAPGGAEFQAAMGAIFGAAYSLQFLLRDRGIDAHMRPVEALWRRHDGVQGWSEGPEAFDPTHWSWTLFIPISEEAADEDIASALAIARRRRPSPAVERLYVKTLDEGLVVEAMHVGPYATEPETIAAMHRMADAAGLRPEGAHHEIYLGDPRRTTPDRLRTVLRQPVRPTAT